MAIEFIKVLNSPSPFYLNKEPIGETGILNK